MISRLLAQYAQSMPLWSCWDSTWGENYWDTYSSVVDMLILCLLLAIAHIHGLDSKSINFGLAFPQADKNADMFG